MQQCAADFSRTAPKAVPSVLTVNTVHMMISNHMASTVRTL